jgi:AraC-like DNA-binding protein
MLRINPDKTRQSAFVYSEHSKAGTVPLHAHRRAQLLYVSVGVLTVRTEQGVWVVPPQRAVWILPGVRHSVYSSRPYYLCTLYVEASLIELPSKCTVVAIEPLVRELLLAAALFGPEYDEGSAEERLIRVALDRLPILPQLALHLPEPRDDRLRHITEGLQSEPSNTRPLSEWAQAAGLTTRNAERLFHRELGMTFGKWRQQLRLLLALEQLASGEKVTNVALNLGYSDVSSFIAMFKATQGTTPTQYFRQPMV